MWHNMCPVTILSFSSLELACQACACQWASKPASPRPSPPSELLSISPSSLSPSAALSFASPARQLELEASGALSMVGSESNWMERPLLAEIHLGITLWCCGKRVADARTLATWLGSGATLAPRPLRIWPDASAGKAIEARTPSVSSTKETSSNRTGTSFMTRPEPAPEPARALPWASAAGQKRSASATRQPLSKRRSKRRHQGKAAGKE
mmetsp:Transcript_86834/g.219005  ORF Transcript_86834/g.219005 Transcript_86834/m.219005 type:complete len:210 (-) Transcript_86834:300-929(-)